MWDNLDDIILAVGKVVQPLVELGWLGAAIVLATFLAVVAVVLSFAKPSFFRAVALIIVFLFFILIAVAAYFAGNDISLRDMDEYLVHWGLKDDIIHNGLSDEEILRKVQLGLSTARCDPGKIDGRLGPQTQAAIERYNHFSGEACSKIQLGSEESSGSAWRSTLIHASRTLERCEAGAAICPPVRENYSLSRDSFCLIFNQKGFRAPGEWAEWSGLCDSDGYASSVGILSWYFSDGRQQPVSFSGLLERGRYSDGELINMRDFPTESIGRFENGRLDGEGKICFPTAGTCRFGTFSEGIYRRGSGFLLFEKYGDKYYGSFRRGLPNGEGRKVFNDHPRYLYWDGRWENGTFVSGHKEPR